MKVVHINWGLTYGGIETMLVNIANAQAVEGAEVHVCIINDLYKEELIKSFRRDVKLHFLNRKSNSKGTMISLAVLLKRSRISTIPKLSSSSLVSSKRFLYSNV